MIAIIILVIAIIILVIAIIVLMIVEKQQFNDGKLIMDQTLITLDLKQPTMESI
jgi:hypothetical protein